ncbi:MAG: hypothetical protein AAF197_02850 [Pseudomonadota bacterium]
MQSIVQIFEIITRQRAPGDLEYNPAIAVIAGAVLISLGTYINSGLAQLSTPMLISAVQVLGQAMLTFVLLNVQGKGNRFVQTISAIFGVTVIVQVMALLTTPLPGGPAIAMLLNFWGFFISVIILKDALESGMLVAILWTITISIGVFLMLFVMFPDFEAFFKEIMEQVAQESATN